MLVGGTTITWIHSSVGSSGKTLLIFLTGRSSCTPFSSLFSSMSSFNAVVSSTGRETAHNVSSSVAMSLNLGHFSFLINFLRSPTVSVFDILTGNAFDVGSPQTRQKRVVILEQKSNAYVAYSINNKYSARGGTKIRNKFILTNSYKNYLDEFTISISTNWTLRIFYGTGLT